MDQINGISTKRLKLIIVMIGVFIISTSSIGATENLKFVKDPGWKINIINVGKILVEEKPSQLVGIELEIKRRSGQGQFILDPLNIRINLSENQKAPLYGFFIIELGNQVSGISEGMVYSGKLSVGSSDYQTIAAGPPYNGKVKILQISGGIGIVDGIMYATPGSIIRMEYKPTGSESQWEETDYLHITTSVWKPKSVKYYRSQKDSPKRIMALSMYGEDFMKGGAAFNIPPNEKIHICLFFPGEVDKVSSLEISGQTLILQKPSLIESVFDKLKK